MTILYHKNCMDGLASAYVAKQAYPNAECVAISYDDNPSHLTNDKSILFVDFCPTKNWLESNSANYDSIIIIDHHRLNVEPLLQLNLPNVTIHFDNTESGATLTSKILLSNEVCGVNALAYIRDRDLWQWKLPFSKEYSEGLKHKTKLNDLHSFTEAVQTPIHKLQEIGKLLVEATNSRVEDRLGSAFIVTINNTECVCLNATSDISELGNALCNHYNKPSATYQIGPNGEVWWSFRSLESLPSVDNLAKSLGGGGHRNASGATTDLLFLQHVLKAING